jgi:hypothetical protein
MTSLRSKPWRLNSSQQASDEPGTVQSAACSDGCRPAVPLEVGRGGIRPADQVQSLTCGGWWSSGGLVGDALAQGIAAELEAVGVVDQAVEHGIGERRNPKYRRMPPLLMGWSLTSR